MPKVYTFYELSEFIREKILIDAAAVLKLNTPISTAVTKMLILQLPPKSFLK